MSYPHHLQKKKRSRLIPSAGSKDIYLLCEKADDGLKPSFCLLSIQRTFHCYSLSLQWNELFSSLRSPAVLPIDQAAPAAAFSSLYILLAPIAALRGANEPELFCLLISFYSSPSFSNTDTVCLSTFLLPH